MSNANVHPVFQDLLNSICPPAPAVEAPIVLEDNEWLDLAALTFKDAYRFTPERTKEIWRNVYRIASEQI